MAALDPIHWSELQDPNHHWAEGPQAPRRPPKSNRECKRQIVWPRDQKQKGAHTWGRFRDVFRGKGPDMWVGKQGDDGPNRQAWTHWGYGLMSYLYEFDNMGYRDKRDNWPGEPHHWRLGNRPTTEKYDFKSRTYKRPRPGDWSDVKWDRHGRKDLYHRHVNGVLCFSPRAIQQLTDFEYYNGFDPYRYNPNTPDWDWYQDERP
ncbi:hypothetical protein XPA_007064 [Xanthoria parietina]